ncbi:17451_t:CDS:2, partial [Dentiscutata erythropus]
MSCRIRKNEIPKVSLSKIDYENYKNKFPSLLKAIKDENNFTNYFFTAAHIYANKLESKKIIDNVNPNPNKNTQITIDVDKFSLNDSDSVSESSTSDNEHDKRQLRYDQQLIANKIAVQTKSNNSCLQPTNTNNVWQHNINTINNVWKSVHKTYVNVLHKTLLEKELKSTNKKLVVTEKELESTNEKLAIIEKELKSTKKKPPKENLNSRQEASNPCSDDGHISILDNQQDNPDPHQQEIPNSCQETPTPNSHSDQDNQNKEIYYNNLYPISFQSSLKNEYSLPNSLNENILFFSQDTIISDSSEDFLASESPTFELEVFKNNVNYFNFATIPSEDLLTMNELKKIGDKINALDLLVVSVICSGGLFVKLALSPTYSEPGISEEAATELTAVKEEAATEVTATTEE